MSIPPFLHFELCYYAALEYCIDHRLEVFEPGAGGDNFKLVRGFLPFAVSSMHLFHSEVLQRNVDAFLAEERNYHEVL